MIISKLKFPIFLFHRIINEWINFKKKKNWLVTRSTLFPVQKNLKNDITWPPKNTTRGDSIQSPSPIGPARTRGGLVGLYCQQKEETIENTHVLVSHVFRNPCTREIVVFYREATRGVGQPVRDFALASAKHLSHASPRWKIENRFRKRHAHAPRRNAITWVCRD